MSEVVAAPVSPGGDSSASAPETPVQTTPIPDFKGTKHKIKVDDQEEELDYEELVTRAQKAKGSEKRFEESRKALDEASRTKKEIEELKTRIKAGDVKALIDLVGYDEAIKISENLTWEKIQWDDLSDDEKERVILKHENEQYKSSEEKRKADQEASVKAAKDAKANAVIEKEMNDVAEILRTEGLPEHDVQRIQEQSIDDMIAYLDYLDSQQEAGMPLPSSLLSFSDVARKIQSRMVENFNSSIGKLSVDQLRSSLSKEQLAGLRQLELDDLAPIHDRTKPAQSKAEKLFEAPAKPSKAARRMSTDEAFDRLDSLYD